MEVDPLKTSLSGYTFRVALNREKGPVLFNAAFGATSPGFDSNDVGITFRTDQINGHVSGGYRWTQPGRFYRNAGVQGGAFRTNDFGGNMTSLGLFSWYWMGFKNYWGVEGSVFANPESITTTQTRGGVAMLRPTQLSWDVGVNSDDRKSLTVRFGATGGSGRQDSNFARGGYVSLNWKPAPKLSVSVRPEYDYQRNGAQFVANIEDPAAVATYGTRHVFARLKQETFSAGIRLNWTFTPALSLQTYIQPLISSGAVHGLRRSGPAPVLRVRRAIPRGPCLPEWTIRTSPSNRSAGTRFCAGRSVRARPPTSSGPRTATTPILPASSGSDVRSRLSSTPGPTTSSW